MASRSAAGLFRDRLRPPRPSGRTSRSRRAGVPPFPAPASPRHAPPHRRAADLQILHIAGARIGGAHQTPRRLCLHAFAVATNGASVSLPMYGFTVTQSAAKPGLRAERGARVAFGGGADVAALGVEDARSSRALRPCSTQHARGRVAHLAELLEQAELRLQHACNAWRRHRSALAPNFTSTACGIIRCASPKSAGTLSANGSSPTHSGVCEAAARFRSGGRRRARSWIECADRRARRRRLARPRVRGGDRRIPGRNCRP
jgi:hypothetical protein